MRAVAPLRAEDRGVALECGIGEQPLGDLVVQAGPLEVEEEERRLDLCVLLAHLLGEGATALVGRVGGEPEAGVGLDPGRDRAQPLGLGDGVVQLLRGKLAEPAAVALPKGVRAGCGLVEVLLQARVVGAFVEIVEVPLDLLGPGDGRAHGRQPIVPATHGCSRRHRGPNSPRDRRGVGNRARDRATARCGGRSRRRQRSRRRRPRCRRRRASRSQSGRRRSHRPRGASRVSSQRLATSRSSSTTPVSSTSARSRTFRRRRGTRSSPSC